MGWLFQQGTPGNTTVVWPSREAGRGSSAPDTNPSTLTPASGLPKAILVTDWVNVTGGKLEFLTGDTPDVLQTIFVRFDGDPPYLPYRIEIDDEGLPMPAPWAARFSCSIGQFDAILIYRDL